MVYDNADGFSFVCLLSPDHPQPVLHSMETIMITVIDESEEVSMDLLEILLAAVKKESQVSFFPSSCFKSFQIEF